ncbi:MAG: vWA domain-containing protein [Flavobacteriales bacterium]
MSNKNTKTYYQFILDNSSSMASCWLQTLSAYNEHLDEIKQIVKKYPEQEIHVSLCTFNNTVLHPRIDQPIHEFNYLRSRDIDPQGMTALLDAIGTSVDRIRETHGAEIDANKASVVCIILTDGEENASRYYGFPQIARLIDDLEATEKWSFTFIGADIDAWRIGRMLNIKMSKSVSIGKQNMKASMHQLSNAMEDYMAKKSTGGKFDFLFGDKKDRE